MNWFLDVFAEDARSTIVSIHETDAPFEQALRDGVCEDDYEATTHCTMMPDESEHEGGSPLNFRE